MTLKGKKIDHRRNTRAKTGKLKQCTQETKPLNHKYRKPPTTRPSSPIPATTTPPKKLNYISTAHHQEPTHTRYLQAPPFPLSGPSLSPIELPPNRLLLPVARTHKYLHSAASASDAAVPPRLVVSWGVWGVGCGV